MFVGNLSYEVSERELRDTFAVHVGVEKVEIPQDRATGKGKGFAFVTLVSSADTETAMAALNGFSLRGRKLRVEQSKPRERRDRGMTPLDLGGRRRRDDY